MGKGESEEWDEKHPDTRQTQPQRFNETETKSSGSKCPACCLKTRDCLMSPECGRALQISSVVAMCGMCIRMFVCKSQPFEAAMKLIKILPTGDDIVPKQNCPYALSTLKY